MLYYRVPANMDNKPLYKRNTSPGPRCLNGWFLIGGELLTPAECRNRNAPVERLEPVNVKRTETYFCFGARFACSDAVITAANG